MQVREPVSTDTADRPSPGPPLGTAPCRVRPGDVGDTRGHAVIPHGADRVTSRGEAGGLVRTVAPPVGWRGGSPEDGSASWQLRGLLGRCNYTAAFVQTH